MAKHSVLFVCMGNICRSPTAEGVFRKLIAERKVDHLFYVDSAGTHAYHVGKKPDPRSQEAARARGVDLSPLRARQLELADFDIFDHLLVMDSDNYVNVMAECPKMYSYKVRYFLDHAPQLGVREVPDPYYGGPSGFEHVLDLVEAASEGLLAELIKDADRKRAS